jgi:hypothetical protein
MLSRMRSRIEPAARAPRVGVGWMPERERERAAVAMWWRAESTRKAMDF